MPLVASRSVQELVGKARGKLGMMQHEFATAVGSSVRTVSRWEGGTSSPAPWHLHALATLLHPVDAALAHDAAYFGGKTLEELGIVKPPPAAPPPPPTPAVAPPPPPAKPEPPLPARVLVDAILFAAIDALGAAPAEYDGVRAALRAAFAHARDLRVDPAQVVEALSPPAPPPPKPEPSGATPAGKTAVKSTSGRSSGRRG